MAEIVWSPQSVEDVEPIRDYISRDSPHFGAHVAQRIVDAVERLEKFPESGGSSPSLETRVFAKSCGRITESFTAPRRPLWKL